MVVVEPNSSPPCGKINPHDQLFAVNRIQTVQLLATAIHVSYMDKLSVYLIGSQATGKVIVLLASLRV